MKRDLNARLERLVNDVLGRLRAERDTRAAFALAGWLATLLWKNHSRIYRLDELETVLLEKVPPLPVACAEPVQSPPDQAGPEIHLATEVYRSGGHTPLMAHLIQQADHPVEVLLTRMTNVQLAAQALGLRAEQVHSTGGENHPVDRVQALVQHLLKSTRVIASIHPNDVIGAVALRMAKGMRPDLPIGFMNHADHVFSTGIGACDHVFEISTYGWGLREARGSTERSTFVGIPIRPRATSSVGATEPGSPPIILTGGSPYKFRPLPGLSLPPVLAELMKRHPTARLTVLGPKSRDWWWWPLRAALGRRVQVRQALPKEQYQRLLQGCSIYIDSHPIPGGTALPEALMAGCNIAGIRGVVWGYSCADELLDTDPDAFQSSCTRLLEKASASLARQEDMRTRCSDWHAPVSVRRRLDASWSGPLRPPPMTINTPSSQNRPLELLWLDAGRLTHPGKKECPLTRHDHQWLAQRHLVHFGWRSWSTLKILFYAHVRS